MTCYASGLHPDCGIDKVGSPSNHSARMRAEDHKIAVDARWMIAITIVALHRNTLFNCNFCK